MVKKIIVIIQARVMSERLRGKVFFNFFSETVIDRIIRIIKKTSFEKEIADKALINTYNFYTLLKSPTSNANLFLHASTKYAKELPGEYAIFEQVVPDKGFKDKGIKTLKFKSGKVEKLFTGQAD